MHLPAIIRDLSVILGVAAVVSFLFRLIRQPVVIGYIVAGVIVGPHTPQLFNVKDTGNISTLAELGVIFFMFSLGLDFSFRQLARSGLSSITTAGVEFVGMLFLGLLMAKLMGWRSLDALFIGCMLCASSTTVIVKAFEELKLGRRRFAEHVFSILIVEDLAAILLLVGLSNLTSRGELGAFELLRAGGTLALVVGSWVLIGTFLVPRFVKAVNRHGNDEMLTIVSIALCLGLVSAAAANHYSVALGAFIMGSILAESPYAERIQTLMRPLRDMFGAVFFISVGMLLDPSILVSHWGTILVLSTTVILGKLIMVAMGSLATGQSLSTSVTSGLSMGQVGEFSFIIATLGLTTNTISPSIYPIIVATSLATTFTTPYFIRWAPSWIARVENSLPKKWVDALIRYHNWTQQRSLLMNRNAGIWKQVITYVANAIIVWAMFALASERITPWLQKVLHDFKIIALASWSIGLAMASPFLWAMFRAFKAPKLDSDRSRWALASHDIKRIASRAGVVILLGLLSLEFFPGRIAILCTFSALVIQGIFFRRRLEEYYKWFETQFALQLQGQEEKADFAHLAPFDSRLAEISIPLNCFLVGKSLQNSKLREHYDLNVVFLRRRDGTIITARAHDLIYPEDHLLCFGTEGAIEALQVDLDKSLDEPLVTAEMANYALRRVPVEDGSEWTGAALRQLKLTEKYHCLVVGVERGQQRMQNPKSDMILKAGDVLWLVGDRKDLGIIA